MNEIKVFRIITAVMLVIWMVFISSLSAQNAEKSSKTSGNLIVSVVKAVNPKFKELTPEEQQETVSRFQFTVRKAAHFTAYGILGALAFLTFITYRRLYYKIRLILSALICLLYAISDEIHQLFVPGRSGEVRDVLIDFSGAMLAIIICAAVCRFFPKIYRHTRMNRL